MRKSAAFIVLVSAALLLASACGGDGQPADTPAPTDTIAPTDAPTSAPSPTGATGTPATGKIAFYSARDGNHEIYIMNADGSSQTNLTSHPAFDQAPAL